MVKLLWCFGAMVAITVFFSVGSNGLRQMRRGALHTFRSTAGLSSPRGGMVLRSVASSSDQGQKAQMASGPSSAAGGDTKWTVSKIRSQFVDYFKEQHEHKNVLSSPVVPVNDPTLLFTNAGMNQFKPIFMGTVDPTSPLAGLKRAVNSQKCIRAGGKHNDLDDVGKDTYHHTFFEMLGTWSFGDYFKEETIDMAWDLLVNVYGLPQDRLYASYFQGDPSAGVPPDDEAKRIWSKYLPAERILPFDKADNFWEMGDTGPCGPCTEIHFDRIGGRDAAALVNADDPDVIEIWNLVFIQFNRETGGELRPLPEKHVDTGMGLERIASILQDKRSNYDSDAFTPLFKAIQAATENPLKWGNHEGGEKGGHAHTAPPYSGKLGAEDAQQNYRDTAYRIVADHIRTLGFAIADGALPSNEGRGYVLRRVLRRAVRYGTQTLGAPPGFFATLVPALVATYGEAFPELCAKQSLIAEVIAEEEEAFGAMLGRGIRWFDELAVGLKEGGAGLVSGQDAFYLYDTLGFPVDLTQLMAEEKGLAVDMPGFQQAMQHQKERSRFAQQARKLKGGQALTLGAEQTSFLAKQGVLPTHDEHKYTWDGGPVPSVVQAVFTAEEGFVSSLPLPPPPPAVTPLDGDSSSFGVILESSPFYAEAGGQTADLGQLRLLLSQGQGEGQGEGEGEDTLVEVLLDVLDVQSFGGYLLHTCSLSPSSSSSSSAAAAAALAVSVGDAVSAEVDYTFRRKVAPNHTMTHVLNYALRKVLGATVDQKGSSVTEDKLRFDFNAKAALTPAQLVAVETELNRVVQADLKVSSDMVPLAQAQAINGLRAVFGEKYPDPVRVVSVGADVQALLAAPESPAWLDSSIEFCGGTHLQRTGQALAVCVVEEAAVAKGIRRVSAITGPGAVEALRRGDQLAARFAAVEANVDAFASASASASGGDGDSDGGEALGALEAEIVAFRVALDAATMSAGRKGELRSSVEALQRRVAGLKNEAFLKAFQERIRPSLAQVREAQAAGLRRAVLSFDVGCDGKAVKRAIGEVQKVAPELSFLGVSSDGEKLAVFAVAAEADLKSGTLDAGAWVRAAVTPSGGRGGGKPAMAQGSIADATLLEPALAAAQAYLAEAEAEA